MKAVRIRFPDGRLSWTVIDEMGEPVPEFRHWLTHLEQTFASPNTVQAYARHMARLGTYLKVQGKGIREIAVSDYDGFLVWLGHGGTEAELPSPNLVVLHANSPQRALSNSLRSQIHLAVKSFYRYLLNSVDFQIAVSEKHRAYDPAAIYKPFLAHISQRRITRTKDRYLRGNLGQVRRKVSEKRLVPEQVLELVKACQLLRDAFLVVLLYNTGMRIGEALGLRHADIDLAQQTIWVVPRDDNENGARAKSGRLRAIPTHDYVLSMYEDYITSAEYLDAFESGTQYVFCNVQQGRIGRALTLSYAEKLCLYLTERSGVTFNWHMFRHTHASEAIAQGYSLLEVADRLGHASPQTTAEFYRHLFSSEIRKLHLTGPERIQARLQQIREAELFGKDLRWS